MRKIALAIVFGIVFLLVFTGCGPAPSSNDTQPAANPVIEGVQFAYSKYQGGFTDYFIFGQLSDMEEADFKSAVFKRPDGSVMVNTGGFAWKERNDYYMGQYNSTSMAISYSPYSYRGVIVNFPGNSTFSNGKYRFEIESKDGGKASKDVNYNGKLEMTPITDDMMDYEKNPDGSISLYWQPFPAGAQTQIRANLVDEDRYELWVIKMPVNLTSATIPASVVSDMMTTRNPKGIHWRMEARYYQPDGLLTSRAISLEKHVLITGDATQPTLVSSLCFPQEGAAVNVNAQMQIRLVFSEPMDEKVAYAYLDGNYITDGLWSADRTTYTIPLDSALAPGAHQVVLNPSPIDIPGGFHDFAGNFLAEDTALSFTQL